MRIPNPLRFLLTGKPDGQEKTYPDNTQYSSDDSRRYRAANQHATAYDAQYRSTERHYWGEQLRVAEEMNRLTGKLNYITTIGIILTFISILLLVWTLVVTIRNAQEDKRSWVGLGEIQVLGPPIAKQPLSIRAAVRNSGESPAVHARIYGHLSLLRSAGEPKQVPFTELAEFALCLGPKPQWDQASGGMIIIPGDEILGLTESSQPLPVKYVQALLNSQPVSAWSDEEEAFQEMEAIPTPPDTPPNNLSWQVNLFFIGCINYFDAFHQAHRTSFCYRYFYERSLKAIGSAGGFSICEWGNDAD